MFNYTSFFVPKDKSKETNEYLDRIESFPVGSEERDSAIMDLHWQACSWNLFGHYTNLRTYLRVPRVIGKGQTLDIKIRLWIATIRGIRGILVWCRRVPK